MPLTLGNRGQKVAMARLATAASSTGRVGRGACKGRRSPRDVPLYRPAKSVAVTMGVSMVGSRRKEKANYYVAVARAPRTAKGREPAIATATGVVGRITTAWVARGREFVPPPHAGAVPGNWHRWPVYQERQKPTVAVGLPERRAKKDRGGRTSPSRRRVRSRSPGLRLALARRMVKEGLLRRGLM